MKIIEFNGVPGCGKSTVCQEIYKYYEKNTEKRAIYYKNSLNKNIMIKSLQCFLILCRAFVDKNQRELLSSVFYLGYMMLCQNGIRKNILYQSQYLYKMVIIADYCRRKSKENNVDIILIDQGITQYIVSALYELNYKSENIVNFFAKLNFYTDNCYVVECVADIKMVMDRLQKRKNGKSRIDQLCYEQREEKLLQQKVIFDDMRESYSKYIEKIIRINTTKITPYENSQIIIEKTGRSLLD